jgi:hypothetical protein
MTNKGADMTEFESKCYGMTERDICVQYKESTMAKMAGLEMVVMSVLSDCQEMMALGTGPHSTEWVRKHLNIAKYLLSELREEKSNV